MRDIYEVLYRKERDLRRLRHEIEMLNTVIPLLVEETDNRNSYGSMCAGATVIQFDRAGSYPSKNTRPWRKPPSGA
jgi:hypothetical protein